MSALWRLAALFYLLFPRLAAIGPLRAVRPYVEPANPVRPNVDLHGPARQARGEPGQPPLARRLWLPQRSQVGRLAARGRAGS